MDGSPALDGAATAYVAGEDAVLRALDQATGTTRWTANLSGAAYSSPAVAGGVVYVGTRTGTIAAYNTVNGALLFSDQTGGPVLSSPAELNQALYVGSGDGKLYAYTPAPLCNGSANAIACENSKPGTPQSTWDVTGAGDPSIQGFTTDISVNVGGTVHFKIKTPAGRYHADVYRLGFYGGNGARKIGSFTPSVALPQTQPTCRTDSDDQPHRLRELVRIGIVDHSDKCGVGDLCGEADPRRRRERGEPCRVRRARRRLRTPICSSRRPTRPGWRTTRYGGAGIYMDANGHHTYKASYNRPFDNRGSTIALTNRNQVFGESEYPMVRFLEANGYDVTYTSGLDTDRFGAQLLNHKVFLSVGHDEYWSRAQRDNVEAARAAGVHLAFFSGNELFWKSRWEPSIDPSATPNPTLVVYKEPFFAIRSEPDVDRRLARPAVDLTAGRRTAGERALGSRLRRPVLLRRVLAHRVGRGRQVSIVAQYEPCRASPSGLPRRSATASSATSSTKTSTTASAPPA